MRTQLVTLAAAFGLFGFTMAAVGATTSASGGGASASSGSGSSSSTTTSSSGTSSGTGSGSGGGGGGAHGGSGGSPGGSALMGHAGASYSGFGNVASQRMDVTHGGYRVLDTRLASVSTGRDFANHLTPTSLELGPATGSAAKAALVPVEKTQPTPGTTGATHPHVHPRHLLNAALPVEDAVCLSIGCEFPPEFCLLLSSDVRDHDDINAPVDCPQPRRLRWSTDR
jgi:hypothetical protein